MELESEKEKNELIQKDLESEQEKIKTLQKDMKAGDKKNGILTNDLLKSRREIEESKRQLK